MIFFCNVLNEEFKAILDRMEKPHLTKNRNNMHYYRLH